MVGNPSAVNGRFLVSVDRQSSCPRWHCSLVLHYLLCALLVWSDFSKHRDTVSVSLPRPSCVGYPSALTVPDVCIGWHPTARGSTPTTRPLLPSDVLGLVAHVQTFFPGPVSRNSRPDLPRTATGLTSLGGILSNSVALPEPRLAGLYTPRSYLPFACPRDPSFRSPYSFGSWARWGFTTV